MSERCPQNLCDGTGWREEEASRTAFPCACRSGRISRARARSLSAVIPPKFRGVSLERPPIADLSAPVITAVRRYVATIDEQLDTGRGLWFMGDVGTGKTSLAMLVSQAALSAGRSVAIYSLPRLIAEIRRTYDDDARYSDVELLDRLAAVDLLHIDDVGAERTSEWVLEVIYSIVNARYEDERAMVITTNISDREALEAQITPRTVSRLTEMCEEIPVFGEDRRLDARLAQRSA